MERKARVVTGRHNYLMPLTRYPAEHIPQKIDLLAREVVLSCSALSSAAVRLSNYL
jgi:hypothetical protein